MAASGDQLLMNQTRPTVLLPEVTVTVASNCHSLTLVTGTAQRRMDVASATSGSVPT